MISAVLSALDTMEGSFICQMLAMSVNHLVNPCAVWDIGPFQIFDEPIAITFNAEMLDEL